MGLELRNPLVASPSPLAYTLEGVQSLAERGVGAIVLFSLFEARRSALVRRAAKPYVTTHDGLARPWRYLERYASSMKACDLALGGAYVASGLVEQDAPESAVRDLDRLRAEGSPATP